MSKDELRKKVSCFVWQIVELEDNIGKLCNDLLLFYAEVSKNPTDISGISLIDNGGGSNG